MASEREDVSRPEAGSPVLQSCHKDPGSPAVSDVVPRPNTGPASLFTKDNTLWEPEPRSVGLRSRFCQNCVPLRTQGGRDHARPGEPGHE